MSQNVAAFVWRRLSEWGLSRVYGYPGDGVGGLDVALEKAKDIMEYVQVRHEEMAAFMASAHAKFTGQVGLCYATSGPGAIHLLNGLYDAKADHVPVVAIVGQQARSALGASYQQEVDLQNLFKDVAGEYVMTAIVPAQVRTLIDRAVRIAHAKRCVTCVIIPNDLQEADYEEPPMAHGATHTGVGFPGQSLLPDADALRRAAAILNSGKKVAMLVGAGALHATDEVIAVAERLHAGVAKALLGKAVLPDDLPYVTGSLGLLGTKPSWDLMKECDTLLMVGSAFPYSEFLPEPGKARGVQIDIDGANLSLRYPMEYSLIGDSKLTLAALLPLLEQHDDGWRKSIEAKVADWWKTLDARAMEAADPINPQRVFRELSPLLPEDVIMAGDSGSVANWYARDIRIRRGMMGSLSGGLASLGAATPYAMAAKMAHPHRPVIGFIGDGAMQMNGLNVMITIGKYWRQWPDPRFIIMVLNNEDLNQVTWEERVQLGEGKTPSTQTIPNFPYHRYAELIGLKGIFCDDPERIAGAWQEALAADRPVILEFKVDPNVPPLPPHITLKDAKNFMAMMRSEPELGSVIRNSAKELLANVLPGRG